MSCLLTTGSSGTEKMIGLETPPIVLLNTMKSALMASVVTTRGLTLFQSHPLLPLSVEWPPTRRHTLRLVLQGGTHSFVSGSTSQHCLVVLAPVGLLYWMRFTSNTKFALESYPQIVNAKHMKNTRNGYNHIQWGSCKRNLCGKTWLTVIKESNAKADENACLKHMAHKNLHNVSTHKCSLLYKEILLQSM